jgi:hypothetical protein
MRTEPAGASNSTSPPSRVAIWLESIRMSPLRGFPDVEAGNSVSIAMNPRA